MIGMNGNDSDSLLSTEGSMDLSIDNEEDDGDDDGAEISHRGLTGDDLQKNIGSLSHEGVLENEAIHRVAAPPPIFVRFKLDGEPASLKDLQTITKSTSLLAAEISLFKAPQPTKPMSGYTGLPWSHQVAAIEISALLKSYVAEQTIERIRHYGRSISDENIMLVKKCLKRVRSVVSFSLEVFFYVSKTDQMVPASAPAGGELEVEEGFLLLTSELHNNVSFDFEPVSGDGFVVSSAEKGDKALEFWSFVYLQKSEGIVSSQIYHPEGEEKAMAVTSRVHEVISSCVHRVNQQLLLKR
jgi:hypothetical protein